MADPEKARLLSLLEDHGRSFLSSFASTSGQTKKRKHPPNTQPEQPADKIAKVHEDEAEEWFGIAQESLSNAYSEESGEEQQDSGSEFEHTDDEFTTSNLAYKTDNKVIVFSEPGPKKKSDEGYDYASKAQMKAFMSSKITKLTGATEPSTFKKDPKEEDEDKTNAQNDALLHKLVHTKLLSGSLNPDLNLPSAKRRKALAGRVLELTGEAKLGKGERAVRNAEKTKASKRVREGLTNKQKERSLQELEEAKNLGNYHPTLKKVFEASTPASKSKSRVKGLKMGVGKFSNGSLRLGREDVDKALGTRGFSYGDSVRGRGGSRSRGKRK
ncbi:hypothetical protein JR316_0005020 [Psilocybe cubensis]|uniref:Protein FAF1 n=2 Tax=Psilocybe cubensis TaxID=181762 RepID=A0A8H8CK60_PSICU|nr:hypothetical protein JR316_0005020 [Psilocybe cubensis]KAH9482920.1 hypothetical protein JR316_0005020 [Psilocybe cubensis]